MRWKVFYIRPRNRMHSESIWVVGRHRLRGAAHRGNRGRGEKVYEVSLSTYQGGMIYCFNDHLIHTFYERKHRRNHLLRR